MSIGLFSKHGQELWEGLEMKVLKTCFNVKKQYVFDSMYKALLYFLDFYNS